MGAKLVKYITSLFFPNFNTNRQRVPILYAGRICEDRDPGRCTDLKMAVASLPQPLRIWLPPATSNSAASIHASDASGGGAGWGRQRHHRHSPPPPAPQTHPFILPSARLPTHPTHPPTHPPTHTWMLRDKARHIIHRTRDDHPAQRSGNSSESLAARPTSLPRLAENAQAPPQPSTTHSRHTLPPCTCKYLCRTQPLTSMTISTCASPRLPS